MLVSRYLRTGQRGVCPDLVVAGSPISHRHAIFDDEDLTELLGLFSGLVDDGRSHRRRRAARKLRNLRLVDRGGRRPVASRETGVVTRIDETSRRAIYREYRACYQVERRGGVEEFLWTPASSSCAEQLLDVRGLTDQELRRIESEGREKGWPNS